MEKEKLDIQGMSDEEFYKIPKRVRKTKTETITKTWLACFFCEDELQFFAFQEGTINCTSCGKHNRVDNNRIRIE